MAFSAAAQYKSNLSAQQWVDSVYKSLSNDQHIAQLMVVRAHSNLGSDHVTKLADDIKKYNIGSLCFFQGGPVRQANLTNYYQSIAQTPILITIDGEYGLGMRLDSVIRFPYQISMGAMVNTDAVYQMGKAVGEQHKRIGVQVDFAPVVDINNNPNNPVIGFRSFGEDKYRVAQMGVAYMKGLQDAGIMASAKHFPGHGDVDVDSHLDLPVIKKTRAQLDSMELFPFRALINAGVQSVMVAHLSIPSIDNGTNRATSISKNAVNGLLRHDLGFDGLTFTDALEMKGVAKYFPGGTIAVEALIAGNDMLCLPESVPQAISAIKEAIQAKKLSWKDIETKVKRVLLAKYNLGLNQTQYVNTQNLLADLNAKTNSIRAQIARQALTVIAFQSPNTFRNDFFTLPLTKDKKIAYVAFCNGNTPQLAGTLQKELNVDVFAVNYADSANKNGTVIKAIQDGRYDAVVIGFHNVNLRKGNNNYGISQSAIQTWYSLNKTNAVTMVFGNPLATENFCTAKNLVCAYEDDTVFQNTAADWLMGKFTATGTLPVTVCNRKAGYAVHVNPSQYLQPIGDERFAAVDSIALDGIQKKAFPGCVILAAKDGKIVYHKAFGNYGYNADDSPMELTSIFDLASVTKVSAVTLAVMKLDEQKKINLDKKLSDYLPYVKKTNKANLTLKNIILHQAGMVPFIAFYKETLDSSGNPRADLYRTTPEAGFTTQVARDLYIRNDWKDTIWKRIAESPVTEQGGKYVYSDNDFWFLGKIVETVTHLPLEKYVRDSFYIPMHMNTTGYHPLERFPLSQMVPTELEKGFRNQLMQGTVHDEGAALGGGVAGHAGLFSDAYDLGKLYQMLLNGGELNGHRFLNWETILKYTAYQSSISRRGFGFDKPENPVDPKDPYPSLLASPRTFGHTGFTGTCVWVDPAYNIVYIFLSNRVNPTRNNPRLGNLQIRGKIQDAIYSALGNDLPVW
jgi:beta-glucosidase-like glycosyl hydrolase/CubicO group peptidase (beta-lactamase class C family)